jgi:Uma2 family endonuclease
MSTRALMTVEQFVQVSTTAADTEDYELVEGELVQLPSGTPRHSIIRDHIGYQLISYFRKNPIGRSLTENDCRLTDDTVRKPDVAIFLGERLQQIDLDKIPAPFAPDIAVEVLSPSESAMDLRRKVRDFLRTGSQEVWLLDHSNAEVLVHTNAGIRVLQGSDILETPLLPGFSAAVVDLVVNL